MCGLIAAWDPAGLGNAPLATALNDIHHRGPDAQASIWRENHRLHLAHARLKIIDTTEGANQPFVSPCGRWAIVYNGEIFNFRELQAEIGDRWLWRTRSDTEVLLAAWVLWGEDCLDRLVGMFAFAVHDAEAHRLSLVRDRFGIKPLYRIKQGERYVFASEIPPLLRFLPTVAADVSTIRTYLEQGLYDHSRYTFFDGIESLPPGTLLSLDLHTGSITERRWYDLAKQLPDISGADDHQLLEQAEALITQAIQSHLIADVAVGLNVSGGVDSSMLVRTALETLGHAHLFTQDYEGYSELPWVREVADGGTLHVAMLDFDRIDSYLSSTVKSQAEPFGGVSVCGYNALYEEANAQDVTVVLDGNGVDEVFLGYKRYHQIHAVEPGIPDAERAQRATDFATFWGHMPRPAVTGASIDGTDGLRPQVMTELLRHAPPRMMTPVSHFLEPARQAAAEDLLFAKIPRGLRFNDRVSMAHSRELRVPFLDHRLVEFGFALPHRLLLGAQGSKLLFRRLLERKVSASVAYAAKRSVQSPQREWLGKAWRPLVESVLMSESFKSRGWVDAKRAAAAYHEYCSGVQENSFFIWQWLNLELWARVYLDGQR